VAFVERALELAAPGGVAALLVPAKLASSGYAESLRQLLARGTRIERAAVVDGAAGAFGAAVYPMALVAARAEPAAHDEVAAVRGRDMAAWRATPRTHLLWTHAADGRPLERLPRELARLLEPHLERLRRRSDYRAGAPWQLFRTGLAHASHRVVWADVARRIAAAVPPPDVVPLNTVYGIATRTAEDAHALAAL